MDLQFRSRSDLGRNLRSVGASLAIFSAAIFLALPSIAYRNSGQDKNQTQAPGPLTPEQIEEVHSRLYGANVSLLDKTGNRVPEIPRQLAKTSGDIYLRNIPVSERFLEGDDPARFAQLACGSDLVALGTAGAGISHMTFDKSFLYTDWEFSVERVFKNNPSAAVQAGSHITLVASGGTLQIDGRTIHAVDGVPFPAAGQRYLIFLTSVPKTGAYQEFNGFLISGATVQSRGAFAGTVDTRTLATPALFKLMEDGTAAANHEPNCKGAEKK